MDNAEQEPFTTGEPPLSNRRIYRDTQHELIGGVAAGVANYFRVDVVWVRLGFVLATVFANGLGIVMYVAAWIIIPEAPKPAAGMAAYPPPPSSRSERSVRYWLGVGLVGLGAVLLLNQLAAPLRQWLGLDAIGPVVFPLVLIGVGVAVWKASRSDGSKAPPTDASTASESSVEGRIERFASTVETGISDMAQRIETAVDAHYATRSDRRVGPVTFGVAFVTFGVMWLLQSVGVAFATTPRMFAVTLLVIGVGLLVGAFRGRGRGLIPTGIVLSVVVLLLSAAALFPDGTRDAFFGSSPGIYAEDVTVQPASLDELEAAYTFSNGQVVVDLRDIDPSAFAAAGVTELDITFGVGDLTVRVPERIGVDVAVSLGLGVIEVGSARVTGWQSTHDFVDTLRADTERDGLLVVTISQGVGSVEVSR